MLRDGNMTPACPNARPTAVGVSALVGVVAVAP
jgi:hypothetical protein